MGDQPFRAPRFLTVAEVADAARVSRMTVYRLVHSGELPAVRVGRSFRVPAAAVEQLLEPIQRAEQALEGARRTGGARRRSAAG